MSASLRKLIASRELLAAATDLIFSDIPDDLELGFVGTCESPASAAAWGQKPSHPEPRLHRLRR